MKKWNTPSISELNINETANGFIDLGFEGKYGIVGSREDSRPVYPGDNTEAHS